MKHSRHHLSQILGERTLHIRDAKELTRVVAAYLLDEGRTADLAPLMRDIMQYRLERGIVEATIVSAHDVNGVVTKDVQALLREEYPKAKRIVINRRIDPSLVGGIRVELPNQQLDLSVRRKLSIFKRLTAA